MSDLLWYKYPGHYSRHPGPLFRHLRPLFETSRATIRDYSRHPGPLFETSRATIRDTPGHYSRHPGPLFETPRATIRGQCVVRTFIVAQEKSTFSNVCERRKCVRDVSNDWCWGCSVCGVKGHDKNKRLEMIY